ncbi:MAG: hypothetical protein K8S87_04575, partial [Planctomycetes bacterium]|nr:hypothetical protein [Planctomycetota bacterium]
DIDHLSSMIIISDGLNNQGLPTTSLMKEIEVNTIAVGSRDTLHHLELFNLQAPTKVSKESDVSLVFNIQADEAYQRDKFGNPGGKNVEVLLYRVVKHPNYEEEIPVQYDALVDVTPGYSKNSEFSDIPDEPSESNTVNFEEKRVKLIPVPATQDFIIDFTPTKGVHFIDFGQKTHFRLKINRKKYIDEDKYDDNIRDFYITFTNDKIKVLYIEGRPRYEWRYLDTVLKRTKKFLYQGFLTSADSGWPQPISMDREDAPEGFTNLTEIPRGNDEESQNRFFENYDVVIIGDVAPHELGKDRMKMLEKFTYDHKGGVIFIAGESYMPKAYSNTVLRDLIPVKLSISSNKKARPNIEKPWKITADGLNHDILRLSKKLSRNELQELWEEKLHGFFWFFNAPEVKEGAIVLMEHPGKAVVGKGASRTEYDMRTEAGGRGLFPLIVWMDTGKNGVLYFGTDDMWYIRGGIGNKFYAPFWVQVISYMASKKRDTSAESAEIYTENRNDPVYTHEDTIRVFGKIRGDLLEKQLTDSGVIITNDKGLKTLYALMRNVSIPNSKPVRVILVDRTGKGAYEKMIFPESVGKYEIWIKDMPNTVHRFMIKPPSIELNEKLAVNVALLTEISHPRPDDLDTFNTCCFYPPRISELVVFPLDLSDKKLRMEEDLWDAPLILILIFCFLSGEWIIRKRSKLL